MLSDSWFPLATNTLNMKRLAYNAVRCRGFGTPQSILYCRAILFPELNRTWPSVLSLLLHPIFGTNSQRHSNLVKVLPLSVKISKRIYSKLLFHLNRLAPGRPLSARKNTSYFPSRPRSAGSRQFEVGSLKYFS